MCLGPDHLGALIAPSVGRSGLDGLKIGVVWGVGHGFSALVLGLSAFYLKGQFRGRFAVLERLTGVADTVVGLSIFIIGLLGIREGLAVQHTGDSVAISKHDHSIHHREDNWDPVTLPASSTTSASSTATKVGSIGAVFVNGVLHGFSWDGAPSLAPAIAMTSLNGAVTYLLSYALGTIVTMSLAAGAMAELSQRVGQASKVPDLPRKLSLASSAAAVVIGGYLAVRSVMLR
jgi:hypothetical protein